MLDSRPGFRVGGRRIYYGWVIVVATLIIYASSFSVQASFGIFFKPILETFGWSRATTSLAMTIHIVLFALALVPSARLVERFGPRRVFAVAALTIGLSVAACSRISEAWQLYLLFGLLFGAGLGTFGVVPLAIITNWFSDNRGVALGLASSGAGVAILLGPPLANAMISAFGWRNSFLILGAGITLVQLACVYFLKGTPPAGQPPARADLPAGKLLAAYPKIALMQIIKKRETILIIAIHGCSTFSVKMVMVHLAPHAIDMGISAAAAALALGTMGGVSIVGRLLMGYVQDRIGPRRSILICIGIQALAMLALPVIYWAPLLFAFAAAFGFTYGGDMPQYPALTAQYFGAASVGVVYSLVATIGNLAGALGPLAAGYIFDLTDSYIAVFLLSALSLIGAFICVLKLRHETEHAK